MSATVPGGSASPPPLLKLLLIGSTSVGKSSLLLRFTEDAFLGPDEAASTIGVDYKAKMVMRNGKKYKITVWDTAGQERFRTLTSSYYRGAHGVVIVYDIAARESFAAVPGWITELETFATRDVIKLLVGNKVDREAQRVVSKEEGETFAKAHDCAFLETSAKTRENAVEVFDRLVDAIVARPELFDPARRTTGPPGAFPVKLDDAGADGWGCRC